jgi:tRNA 2-thiouridine synthesizing protein D
MIYSILIQCPPSSLSTVTSALKFTQAAVAAKHSIHRIFFYGDAVLLANQNATLPQDEYDIYSQWRSFLSTNKIDSVVCIAAALTRGILDANEAKRYDRTTMTGEPYELSGLGQLIDACVQSDRLISFA